MGIKKGLTDAIDSFKEFEKTLMNTVSVSGYLGNSFDDAARKVEGLATTLSKTSIFTKTEIVSAFYDLASAGYDVVQMTEQEFIPILNYAAAQQMDLKDATSDVMIVLKQFNMTLADSGEVVDTFTSTVFATELEPVKGKSLMWLYIVLVIIVLGIILMFVKVKKE